MSPGWRRSSSPAPLAHRKRLRGLTNISTQERESPCHAARCHVQKNLLTSGASYKSGPTVFATGRGIRLREFLEEPPHLLCGHTDPGIGDGNGDPLAAIGLLRPRSDGD